MNTHRHHWPKSATTRTMRPSLHTSSQVVVEVELCDTCSAVRITQHSTMGGVRTTTLSALTAHDERHHELRGVR